MRKPSKRVRDMFAEVETIAGQLVELAVEEQRLRETLERVWRTRTIAMATLAAKAHTASQIEVAEASARRKR
jgi:hypothetical protein